MDDQSGVNSNPSYQSTDNQMPAGEFGTPPMSGVQDVAGLPSYVEPASQPQQSPPPASSNTNHDDLVSIKQQAISQLTPLVKHLDQTPEERFRTTLMMIQVSDNRELIKDAYDAAEQITDEKAKAQALLDIVNEINYFTKPVEE